MEEGVMDAKRGELGGEVRGLRDSLLREGARHRDWKMVDRALALGEKGTTEAGDLEWLKRMAVALYDRYADRWYSDDCKSMASDLVLKLEAGGYFTVDEYEEEMRESVRCYMDGNGWRALVALKNEREDCELIDSMSAHIEDAVAMEHGIAGDLTARISVARYQSLFVEGRRYRIHLRGGHSLVGTVGPLARDGRIIRLSAVEGYEPDAPVAVIFREVVGVVDEDGYVTEVEETEDSSLWDVEEEE
jgi:hypothetical protein